ncbi:hypothetical protein [Microscilla marina]|uniref:Uncharacterized protein n=1 Tax=Microscilla marina ATCC 23134 TaxID=313606 RepID=A1ZLT9_MICM2|nr:hypothetical protein [Microscilla marina]EAY28843.1 hypothetical protein M23134_07941 [Microscilla marina ATCC 23134]
MTTKLYFLLLLVGLYMTGLSALAQKNDNSKNDFALESIDNDFGEFRVIATNNKRRGVFFFQRFTLFDQINVIPKSYVVLLHKSGATVEINKAGTYAIKLLKAQLLAYAKAHPQYPINLKVENPQKSSYKHHYYYHWGKRCPEPPVGILLPSKLKVLSRELSFAWYDEHTKDSSKARYEVVITDMMGEELLKVKSSKRHITLSLSQAKSIYKYHIIKLKLLGSDGEGGCDGDAVMAEYVNNESMSIAYRQFKLKNQLTKSPLIAVFNEMFFWNKKHFYLEVNELWRKLVKKYPKHPVLAIAYQHFKVTYRLQRVPETKTKK